MIESRINFPKPPHTHKHSHTPRRTCNINVHALHPLHIWGWATLGRWLIKLDTITLIKFFYKHSTFQETFLQHRRHITFHTSWGRWHLKRAGISYRGIIRISANLKQLKSYAIQIKKEY